MSSKESIVLGGGCFWCLHAAYSLVQGVEQVTQGYAGGTVPHPTSDQVYEGTTGHAEVVKITFDSTVIKLEEILDIFWTIHDPTTLNRQGNDVGPMYRSAIFYVNETQKKIVEKSLQEANNVWDNKIVTELSLLKEFYPAESYHDNYQINRPDYCQLVINPKLAKLKQEFTDKLKAD